MDCDVTIDMVHQGFTGFQRHTSQTQSGKLQSPETLMAQVFEVAEAEFSALNAEAHAKQTQALPEHELIKEVFRELG
jgi:hypothetical protein